jgi:hypothetical protein
MAGIEMQNVVLIALVLLIVVFVVYQYNPSVFRFMRLGEGFADDKKEEEKKDMASPTQAAQGFMDMAMEEKKKAMGMNANGFTDMAMGEKKKPMDMNMNGFEDMGGKKEEKKEPFADLSSYEGPASFGSAEAPAGCYPRDQLTPAELLPKDMNSIWAEQNPMGPGSLKGKNFLSAGALIGVNTVGQSLRNANLQIRSEPPNPQVPVSIFLQSTIGPDISHRSLEIN